MQGLICQRDRTLGVHSGQPSCRAHHDPGALQGPWMSLYPGRMGRGPEGQAGDLGAPLTSLRSWPAQRERRPGKHDAPILAGHTVGWGTWKLAPTGQSGSNLSWARALRLRGPRWDVLRSHKCPGESQEEQRMPEARAPAAEPASDPSSRGGSAGYRRPQPVREVGQPHRPQ